MSRAGLARPRRRIAIWAVATAMLAALGVGVEQRLHRSDLIVPGTASDQARDLATRHFGEGATFVVMLEGPRAEMDRQGRLLAARLARAGDLESVGPWVPGAGSALRPEAGRAVVLVRANTPFEDASEHVAPLVRREVTRTITGPVKGYVSGYADVASGVHEESVAALERAELIAAPLLLIVLLLVFRSPVAAGLPLALGVATIVAGRGVIDLANRVTDLDVVSLNMASMMGLALGVDYSLVLVSRFREELRAGRTTHEAVAVAQRTAGRTILFAGLALAAAMIAANFVAPGGILVSAGFGVLASVALSVLGAVFALPPALLLLGPRVNKWSFGRSAGAAGGWGALAFRAISRPAVAALLVLVLVVALAAPSLALSMGSPDPRALPESSPHRRDFERIFETLGGGWAAPYEVVVAARNGPITEPERLQALAGWQRELGDSPGVLAVFGPAPIARRMERLESLGDTLRDAGGELQRGRRDQARLRSGLARVDGGVEELRSGLRAAADGARRLADGGAAGAAGADRVRLGLAAARRGAARIDAGIAEAGTGARALSRGGSRLRRGSRELRTGAARAAREVRAGLPAIQALRDGLQSGGGDLERLRTPARRAGSELAAALDALNDMTPTSKADPAYQRAYRAVGAASAAITGRHPITGQPVEPGYDGMDAALGQASAAAAAAAAGVGRLHAQSGTLASGLDRLARGAAELDRGIARLDRGARDLRRGLARLGTGGDDLVGGLERLTTGAATLASGVKAARGGSERLARGLGDGAQRAGALEGGVHRIRAGAASARARTSALTRGMGGVPLQTGLFESGYLPLAALDGAPPAQRTSSTFAVNLDRGGSAARIVVMGGGDPSEAGHPLRDRLELAAAGLARETGTRALVGGPATVLQDFETETSRRLWWLILALVAATYLVLVPVLRSLVLPLIAVVLNLLTVAAAFGVLALGFQGAAPLGGPGDVDAIMVLAIFAIVFGLSIDYEVFLLARMREGYLLTRSTDGAIEYGLRHTAGVITGAALIMTGVFAAFAVSEVINMRQLGVGLTVAVVLDATVIRLVLLPAVIRLVGDRAWALPGPLERVLGRFDPAPATVPADEDGRGPHGDGRVALSRWEAFVAAAQPPPTRAEEEETRA
jgi:RND superfamily putative drug exporter